MDGVKMPLHLGFRFERWELLILAGVGCSLALSGMRLSGWRVKFARAGPQDADSSYLQKRS